MAFLCSESSSALLRDQWPGAAKLPFDPESLDACLDWQVVPPTIAELADWLVVVPKDRLLDKSRPFEVVHASGNANGVKYQLGLRLHGYVQDCELGPFGTWDGTSRGAQQAVQKLVIHGNGNNVEWTETIRQLNHIIAIVTRMVNRTHEPSFLSEDANTFLPLQRRVFVKSTAATPGNVGPQLGVEYTAHARTLQSMASQWIPDSPLPVGRLNANTVRRCNFVLIEPGSFVDVLASIEVVCKRGQCRVHFLLDRVILLGARDAMPPVLSHEPGTIIKASGEDVFDDDDDL